MLVDTTSQRCSQCYEEHFKISLNNNHVPKEAPRTNSDQKHDDCRVTFETIDEAKSAFSDFCRRTSLHGWHHLTEASHPPREKRKHFWILIIIASIGVASFFLFTSVDDFTSRYVVTNIDTTTASLHDVYFPSVIICNINQIRKSLLNGLGLKRYDDIDLLYRQFYTGIDKNLTDTELQIIQVLATSEAMLTKLKSYWAMVAETNSTDIKEVMNSFNWIDFLEKHWGYIKTFDFIRDMVVEDPGDTPIIYASYGNRTIRQNATDLLPFFGTDKGHCSIIKPQMTFNSKYDHLTYAQKLFGFDNVSYTRQIQAGTKVGKVNGLVLLLDAQTFDYTMNRQASEGFKITVNHHLDQPLMSMTELDITPGFETQVAVTPVIYTTSNAARKRFTPDQRGCYFDHERPLTYLPSKWYRYSINNCLFEASYEKILEECQCTPFFHTLGINKCPRICNGASLLCMNRILDQIGEYREIEDGDINIGSQRRQVKCLEACEDQQNQVSVTTSRLPNQQTMLRWPELCIVMEKLKNSCSHHWKRIDLDRHYPRLCPLLLDRFLEVSLSTGEKGMESNCANALNNISALGSLEEGFEKTEFRNSSDEILLSGLFKYARQNLALVNIYIRPPVVTRIMKDERIPVIRFVANCGGILGLCMGFSIVTAFEVLHYMFRFIFILSRKIFKRKIVENRFV